MGHVYARLNLLAGLAGRKSVDNQKLRRTAAAAPEVYGLYEHNLVGPFFGTTLRRGLRVNADDGGQL